MIPEHRLAVLLQQVKQNQISNCLFHNTADSPSLYTDHFCDPSQFPRKTILELDKHSDEVWYLECDRAVLRQRLIARWLDEGRSLKAAVRFVEASDLVNVDLVLPTAAAADRRLALPERTAVTART